jgi:hypothetical protein
MKTPWGQSQYSRRVAPGIVFYGTAGHGGYRLTKAANAKVPAKWRLGGEFERWYEVDLGWAPLAVVFPEAFPKDNGERLARNVAEWEEWVEFVS